MLQLVDRLDSWMRFCSRGCLFGTVCYKAENMGDWSGWDVGVVFRARLGRWENVG